MPRRTRGGKYYLLVEIELNHRQGEIAEKLVLQKLLGEVIADAVGVGELFSVGGGDYKVEESRTCPLDEAQVRRLTGDSVRS